MELLADAEVHHWAGEVERHRRTVERIEQLLIELEQPIAKARTA